MDESSVTRPKLLVSVRADDEAEAALAGGADWIDLKEPTVGPLGAVELSTARQVAALLAGRRPLSAALGELVDVQPAYAQQWLEIADVHYVKVGLAHCRENEHWRDEWRKVEAQVQRGGKSLVAVVYADWQLAAAPNPAQVLALAARSSCQYLLVDTYHKQGPGTLECLGSPFLEQLLDQARQQSLRTVLAGGLTPDSCRSIPWHLLDMVAVRGAVCTAGRTGRVQQHLVAAMRCKISGTCTSPIS